MVDTGTLNSNVFITVPLLLYFIIMSFVQIWWSRRRIKIPMKDLVTTSRVEIVEMERLFSPHSKRKQIIASISTALEVAQLCAFVFSPSIPWSNSTRIVTLPSIMQTFILKFGNNSFGIIFWIVVVMVLFGYFFVDLFVQLTKRFFTIQQDTKNELYSTWYRTFAICIYANLFAAFDCNYTNEGMFLVINPSTKCWEGVQVAYFIVSLLTLVAYDAITFSVLKTNKILSEVTSNCIFYDSLYLALDFRVKMLIVGIMTFYSNIGAAILVSLIILFLILVVLQLSFKPCNFEIINILRLCGLLFVFWSTICGALAWLINDGNNWTPFIAFLLGSILLLPLCVLYYKFTSSRFRTRHPMFSTVRFMASDFDESGFESE